jgi:hypothetical protein
VAPNALADVIGFLALPAARAVHGACVPVVGLVSANPGDIQCPWVYPCLWDSTKCNPTFTRINKPVPIIHCPVLESGDEVATVPIKFD